MVECRRTVLYNEALDNACPLLRDVPKPMAHFATSSGGLGDAVVIHRCAAAPALFHMIGYAKSHLPENRHGCCPNFFAEWRHTIMVVEHYALHEFLSCRLLKLLQARKVLRTQRRR